MIVVHPSLLSVAEAAISFCRFSKHVLKLQTHSTLSNRVLLTGREHVYYLYANAKTTYISSQRSSVLSIEVTEIFRIFVKNFQRFVRTDKSQLNTMLVYLILSRFLIDYNKQSMICYSHITSVKVWWFFIAISHLWKCDFNFLLYSIYYFFKLLFSPGRKCVSQHYSVQFINRNRFTRRDYVYYKIIFSLIIIIVII